MKHIRTGSLVAATVAALTFGVLTVPSAAAVPEGTPVRAIRAIPTGEGGAAAPRGVVWASDVNALLLTGTTATAGEAALAALVPAEERLVRRGVSPLPPDAPLAADPSGRLVAITSDALVSVATGQPTTGAARRNALPPELRGAVAADFDRRTGELVALRADGSLVRVDANGRAVRRAISGATVTRPEALAIDSATGLAYVADGNRLLAVAPSGQVERTHDLSGTEVERLSAMTFAPTSDQTDGVQEQSLFLVDSASATLVEATLEQVVTTQATAVTASLVKVTQTSGYSPPSPDPSGITYLPGRDRLVMVDGEVEEMSIWAGVNVFEANRAGAKTDGGSTTGWSNEPVGAGYIPASNHLLVSDDSKRRVFEVNPAGDGRFGTSDDTVTSFSTSAFANNDPEGVEYDSGSGSIWLSDGVGREVYRVNPGPNGRFDGIAPTGDDTTSNFDVERYGALDPEGVGYDSVRGTILLVDGGSQKIYELARDGSLITTIDIAVITDKREAGVIVAPASDGSGRRNYYVVTRGRDNDSDPNENDGKLWEVRADVGGGGTTNQAPVVAAGPDRSVTYPNAASLDGTVTDDGLPNPPGATTSTWSKVSGPGSVTFANANSVDTTVTASELGTYVLRLTANDSALSSSDDVTVTFTDPTVGQSADIPVRASTDDAEQTLSGTMRLGSADLELVVDGTTTQVVGLRFTQVPVPAGAAISKAYVQFQVDEVSNDPASLTVQAHDTDNAGTFQSVSKDISNRPLTSASVAWTPPAWPTVGARGLDQQTPNLAALVQEVVDRPGWAQGNAMALVINGSGRRTAEAYDGTAAPTLHLEWSTSGTPTNRAPVVSAGSDQTVTYPSAASLDGTVTDDGLPSPPSATTAQWSKVSGPGTATFANAAAVDTSVIASAPGTYVLRLTASDSVLSASDDVTVTFRDPTVTPSANIAVIAGSDDAEQNTSGSTDLTSSDLELTTDGTKVQLVGLRFAGLPVPAGATITNAYVQFTVDEVSTDAASLTVQAQAIDDAPTFQALSNNISNRTRTTASAAWTPPAWSTVGAAGVDQRTPNLASVLQEVIGRPGWAQGNDVAVIITGTGRRTAEAYEGTADPVLHIEWTP